MSCGAAPVTGGRRMRGGMGYGFGGAMGTSGPVWNAAWGGEVTKAGEPVTGGRRRASRKSRKGGKKSRKSRASRRRGGADEDDMPSAFPSGTSAPGSMEAFPGLRASEQEPLAPLGQPGLSEQEPLAPLGQAAAPEQEPLAPLGQAGDTGGRKKTKKSRKGGKSRKGTKKSRKVHRRRRGGVEPTAPPASLTGPGVPAAPSTAPAPKLGGPGSATAWWAPSRGGRGRKMRGGGSVGLVGASFTGSGSRGIADYEPYPSNVPVGGAFAIPTGTR
jgi:hypothetical protein